MCLLSPRSVIRSIGSKRFSVCENKIRLCPSTWRQPCPCNTANRIQSESLNIHIARFFFCVSLPNLSSSFPPSSGSVVTHARLRPVSGPRFALILCCWGSTLSYSGHFFCHHSRWNVLSTHMSTLLTQSSYTTTSITHSQPFSGKKTLTCP